MPRNRKTEFNKGIKALHSPFSLSIVKAIINQRRQSSDSRTASLIPLGNSTGVGVPSFLEAVLGKGECAVCIPREVESFLTLLQIVFASAPLMLANFWLLLICFVTSPFAKEKCIYI